MGRLTESEARRVLALQRRDYLKQYGPVEGRKRWAEELKSRAESSARLSTWLDNQAARLRFIRNRLFLANDLTPAEIHFYARYLYRLERNTEDAPAIVEKSPLWVHWREFMFLGGPDTLSEWKHEVGAALPFRHSPDAFADAVEHVRGELEGMRGADEEELKARHKRGGYAGNRKVARVLASPTYWPEEPCPVHPREKFHTSSGRCIACQEIQHDISKQHPDNARARKVALEIAELTGLLPLTKRINQYSQTARREYKAMNDVLSRARREESE